MLKFIKIFLAILFLLIFSETIEAQNLAFNSPRNIKTMSENMLVNNIEQTTTLTSSNEPSLVLLSCPENANYTISGNAINNTDGSIRLTPNIGNQAGQAWSNDFVNLTSDYTIKFSAYFGASDGGADGIAFLFRSPTSPSTGLSGGGLGYQGITRSVAVEFDTWDNGSPSDIPNDHTSVQVNGNITSTGRIGSNVDLGNIENNAWYNIEIRWIAGTKTLETWINGVKKNTVTRDFVLLDLAGNPVVKHGFTASTGGATNIQAVCITQVTAAACKSTPTLASTSLSIPCRRTTVNLNTNVTSTAPTGTNLVWFTNANHTGTAYSTPTAATAGTYYAFYYDTVNMCYSKATNAVTVTNTLPPTCGVFPYTGI